MRNKVVITEHGSLVIVAPGQSIEFVTNDGITDILLTNNDQMHYLGHVRSEHNEKARTALINFISLNNGGSIDMRNIAKTHG